MMPVSIRPILFIRFGLVIAIAILQGCRNRNPVDLRPDSLAIRKSIAETPVLPPDSAIGKMKVEDGFTVKLVAAEPLVTAPVALSFDEKGRIWAVEMMDYMPDTAGTGEDAPTGKVVILSDTDRDGVMDSSRIFLDSLVLPRAICLIEDGILVAEPPNLWFYHIKNDRAAGRVLVDPAYAAGGNVEHQPNGLFRALDNWIYNAKSATRYKKKGDRWLIEKTHFRGQWGITTDDAGRLYYNTNSDNLLGDYFPPGLGANNPHQHDVAGFSEKIVDDNRVFPIRPTPGVNRGYMQGILDDSLRLVEFTAACGPVLYNGGLYGRAYDGNAFVAEPSANLIKRDVLSENGYVVQGKEAYLKKEFLASTDERFRPVNLHVGPDGALYIADMYRGIIQHKTYLTPYLKNEIKERALTKPLNCGRIYKVVPTGLTSGARTAATSGATASARTAATSGASIFGNKPADWVGLLKSANGWVRSRAQQMLVDAKNKAVVPLLRRMLQDSSDVLARVHALWTLEGLDALQASDLLPLLRQNDWRMRMQALTVLNEKFFPSCVPALKELIDRNDTLAAPYIGFLVHQVELKDAAAAHELYRSLTLRYGANKYVADAIISNLYGKEEAFYKEALTIHPDTAIVLNQRLKKVIVDIARNKNAGNIASLAKKYPRGATIFQSVCQTCHGADGNGIHALSPPLNGSNWVLGDKNRLIPIVLYGLTGPIKVAGKLYKAPEVNGDMPGIGTNKEFTDEDIAQTLSFIRGAWNNKAGRVDAADIGGVRKKIKDRQKAFTMGELEQF